MAIIDELRSAGRPMIVDYFLERAGSAGSQVHRLAGWQEVASLALELADGGLIAVAPSLARTRPDVVKALGETVVDGDPNAVADAPVGVTACPVAVAETGSVVVSEDALEDRTVSMLTRTLVQVVESDRIVVALDDVADWLSRRGAPGYQALVTGPSRTADIERSLTIGVQGPFETHVVVVGDS